MVSIKVDIEFNQSESRMLEMAADIGHVNFGNDELKTILLNAAQRTVHHFTNGVMQDHHRRINPPTVMDEERRIEQQMQRRLMEVERLGIRLKDMRNMRLPKVVPPSTHSPSTKR